MVTEIKPALTAEEWASFPSWSNSEPGEEAPLYYPSPHGIAAANLHKQPFGFTREDVDISTYAAMEIRSAHKGFHVAEELATKLENLAVRIEALLPPEDTNATQEKQPSSEPQHQQVREGGHTAADGGSESTVDGP